VVAGFAAREDGICFIGGNDAGTKLAYKCEDCSNYFLTFPNILLADISRSDLEHGDVSPPETTISLGVTFRLLKAHSEAHREF
jgi:hypothetical protein